MKIYISADIEGISGVVNSSHTSPKGHDYDRARKLMTAEVNAAIRGLKEAGADEIIVNDSHGSMTNILIEELDEGAELITGNQKLLGMMEGIDSTFDAVVLIGYHARHNTPGVLAHSFHSLVVYGIRINGVEVGEFELNTMLAGAFGVPVVFVSGDNVLAEQVRTFDSGIDTLAVKNASSRTSARCISPKRVNRLITEGTRKAITEGINKINPHTVVGEVDLEVTFINSGMAEATLYIPGVSMTAPNTVRYKARDIIEAYKVCDALITLASSTL